MSKTARLGEPIGHSPTMNWLLAGLLIGAAVAIAAVLIVGTGGLAAAAIVGATAATGAGIGEVVSTMSWVPKEIAGAILGACSPNVFINSKPAARAHLDFVQCSKHAGPPMPIATGSDSVFINSHPAARDGDKTSCGGDITDGSANVFIGGGSVQTDIINPEELVPGWVHMTLLAVGMASAIVLAGPFVAAFGLVGGMGGGYFGAWLGGKLFGVGSDGQKWTMLGGAFISGMLATKGGMWFDKNYTITTQGLGSNLGNIKITSKQTESFFGKLRGEEVELPNVKTQEFNYVKRDQAITEILRKEFNATAKPKFLKKLSSDTEKIPQLKKAGLTDADIADMQEGFPPDGWQVHHKIPLDDGGNNSNENLMLIENEPYHKVITNEQKWLTGDLKSGESRIVKFPIPDGYIYPSTK
ncbi:MAG: PAAR domain-containing protein [Proteobacteria bacterium]|nr:PAAR domain-containing protein [Pseudomonadota bacterium]